MTEASTLAGEKVFGSLRSDITLSKIVLERQERVEAGLIDRHRSSSLPLITHICKGNVKNERKNKQLTGHFESDSIFRMAVRRFEDRPRVDARC